MSGGGAASQSSARSSFGGAASVANATGGSGGSAFGGGSGGAGGAATATSDSNSGATGNATSTAEATGGPVGFGDNIPNRGGAATANSNASAAGGGMAMAKAVATGGVGGQPNFGLEGVANATSSAETAKGALAQAQSTALGSSGQALSNALTSYSYVKVQSAAVAQVGSTATTNAIAQGGGSGQAFVNPGQTAYAFSTALPDKAYSATLIDGASNVAERPAGAARRGFRDRDSGGELRHRWRRREPHLQRKLDLRFRLWGRSAAWPDRQSADRLRRRAGLPVDGIHHHRRWRRNSRHDFSEPGDRREFLPG